MLEATREKKKTPSERQKYTHISLFVLRQQLVDGIGKQARVALCILTDALHQLGEFFRHVVQLHGEGHLLPVGQRHLCAQTTWLVFFCSFPTRIRQDSITRVLDRLSPSRGDSCACVLFCFLQQFYWLRVGGGISHVTSLKMLALDRLRWQSLLLQSTHSSPHHIPIFNRFDSVSFTIFKYTTLNTKTKSSKHSNRYYLASKIIGKRRKQLSCIYKEALRKKSCQNGKRPLSCTQ